MKVVINMSRFDEIDEFLKKFAVLYRDNPDLRISKDTFYSALAEYGLTPNEIYKERKYIINDTIKNNYFRGWIDYFKNDTYLNVYYTEIQGRFLQFNSDDRNAECYKLYVSFPEDKMYECVKIIFKFIADNKIANSSKVADCVRSDSVILRINNQKDALKVINFINNNPIIRESCKATNPFLQRSGKVGLAYDRYMSYNSTLSFMLEKYFVEKRKNNTLANVSTADFRNYVLQKYNSIFSNHDSLIGFMDENYVAGEISRLSNEMFKDEVLSNFKDILDLMILQLDPKSRIDDYFSKVEEYNDFRHDDKNCQLINNILEHKDTIDSKQVDIKKIVDDYIRYATKKYGGVSEAFEYLNIYLYEHNIAAITRDKVAPYDLGFRDLFSKYVTYDKLYGIVGNNIMQYMNSVVHVDKVMANESVNKYVIFNKACNATAKKYGQIQLIEALKNGMNGDYSYFTNDGNNLFRDNLIKYVDVESFRQYAASLLDKMNVYGDNKNNNDVKKVDKMVKMKKYLLELAGIVKAANSKDDSGHKNSR